MLRVKFLCAIAAVVVFFSVEAHAVTLETTQFISSPTYFNGFEGISSSPNFNPVNFLYSPMNTPYSEGGITVEYIGSPSSNSGVSTNTSAFIGHQGQYEWYGAAFGYTDVKLTSGANIESIQFLASSGLGGGVGRMIYEVLDLGSVVTSGVTAIRTQNGDRAMTWYGFSGGGFDEIRLQVIRPDSFADQIVLGCASADLCLDAGAFDSFGAVAQTPLPAALPLFATGLGALGLLGRRRNETAYR